MATELMNLLQGQFSDSMIGFLNQQIGGTESDKPKTQAAAAGIVSTLIGALATNAATPKGAESLDKALERDHDGSILDDVIGMLSGNRQPASQKALNGAGIISHILGDRSNGAADMIGKASGLDSGKVNNLMMILAPLVMGTLGKTKKQQGLNVSDLAGLLTRTKNEHVQENPTMALLTRFLDRDGDGSIVDDVANIGMKMLGNFFKRK